MLSQEQILKKHISGYRGNIKQKDAYAAMEEYAKQRTEILEEALETIMQMKLEGGEVDYRFAFNRCWHAANEALNQYRKL